MSENTEKKERVKTYIKASEIRKAIKEGGKRASKDFFPAFDHAVEQLLQKCIREHNAGKKTLDAALVKYVAGDK
jgi:ribosomal protein S20